MKEARLKKTRKCKLCGEGVYGDAKKIQEHIGWHKLAKRAAQSGLLLATPRILTAAEGMGS
jgi:hypothetical protein